MFNLKQKKFDNSNTAPLLQNEPVAPWENIYTMPTGFPSAAKTRPPVPGRKTLLIILLVLLLAVGAASAYWFSRGKLSKVAPVPTVDSDITAPPPSPLAPSPESSAPPVPTTTAAERDGIRYRDIRNLQTALELYKGEQKKYPIALLPLVLGLESTKVLSMAGFTPVKQGTVYLDSVPSNPPLGGLDYLYESSDGVSYTITFSIEAGVAGLAPGEHKATPQGIDGYSEVPPGPIVPRAFTPPNLTTDSDNDGLTDAEELLFGTDSAKPDSDGDSYLDGSEVNQGYDPARAAGAKLAESGNFTAYTNERFNYIIKYPPTWLAKETDSEASEVIFSSADDEFIEVLTVDNPERLDAAMWYAMQVGNLRPEEVPTITYNNATWVVSLDGLNAYLSNGNWLFTISYNIGTKTEASYYHLFQTMIRSFSFLTSSASD